MTAVLILLGACIFAYFFWRDLRLPRTFIPRDLPDLVVENFNFKRTVGSRDWGVVAVSAEHQSGVVRAAAVDLLVDEPEARRTASIHAISGEFVRDNSEMLLFNVDGTVHYPDESADVTAKIASYDAAGDAWLFPSGVELSGEELFMTGEETELDRTVIDEIGDPLMHLLRNAADHGLEGNAKRLEIGKPEIVRKNRDLGVQ